MSEPIGRIRFMDRQRVNLDGFAVENPELGLTALACLAALVPFSPLPANGDVPPLLVAGALSDVAEDQFRRIFAEASPW